MIFKQLGKTSEKLSAIGIGTWQFGEETEEKIKALKTALSSGINFIDTAEIYGTEPVVGAAIKGEKDVFIATKVWTSHFHYDDVLKACDGSLKRLGIKQIGLYQLHWPNKQIPIAETMRAMEKLVEDGKIRYIGVSNFDMKQLIEARNSLSNHDIVSDQVEYSVLVREPEVNLLPYCQKERITIIAYSPLGHGDFFSPKYKVFNEKLSEIGLRYEKSAVQVALNWLIAKDEVIAIPKASDSAHVIEDAKAADFTLDSGDISTIDSESLKFQKKSLKRKMHPLLSIFNFFKRR